MENNHLKSFGVNNFKILRELQVSNIGKFNLIIGENNVGKTTLLESLLLTDAIDETMSGLKASLKYRDISFLETNVNFFNSTFNGLNECTYILEGSESSTTCLLKIKETQSLPKEELDKLNLKNLGKAPLPYVAILEINGKKQTSFLLQDNSAYIPYVSYKIDFATDLFRFYSDNIQISKQAKDQFLSDLILFIPEIENIEPGSIYGRSNTFLISLKNLDAPVTINEFGGGTVKFIRYLLEILVCENKRLMIDEIDTGIHYSKMNNFFIKLLTSSLKRNAQIFATTHSKECIESFTKALEETGLQSEGRIIRLAETKHGIKAYTMEFAEFENALLAESEIR